MSDNQKNTRPRILIVDDHSIYRLGIQNILSPHAEVESASSTSQALEILKDRPVDLIISDINRPESTGLDFLDAVRKDPRTRYTPFVFLTVMGDEEHYRNRALMQGCDEIFSKLESATFLEFRIVRLLERATALKQKSFPSTQTEPLRVFISYAKEDRASASHLSEFLSQNGVIAWFDEKELKAGQEWETEIQKGLRTSHAVILCLSNHSISKTGYVQKEFRIALDLADYQPPGAIFIIPLRIEQCLVPDRFTKWQWLDFFHESAKDRLLEALEARAIALGVLPPRGSIKG